MNNVKPYLRNALLTCIILLLQHPRCDANPIPVRHLEGVTFGFLTLRNLDGEIIANGYLKQVAKPGREVITDDLQFHFKDGSLYRDITKVYSAWNLSSHQ